MEPNGCCGWVKKEEKTSEKDGALKDAGANVIAIAHHSRWCFLKSLPFSLVFSKGPPSLLML
jgi:hypothetical protein